MSKKIVEVQWIDSMSACGWRSEDEAHKMAGTTPLIHSAGYLLRKDKDKIVLVGAYDHQMSGKKNRHNVNHYMEIPMSAVKSIRRVK